MQRLIKDPDSTEWFKVPWSKRLGTAKISAVDYQVPAGLTKEAEAKTDDTASVKLSGGTLGETYTVVCRITTDDSQTLDFSFFVLIRQE